MPEIFPAVKAVIMDRGRFLVIKQDRGGAELWDLPGGRIDYGEAPMDTLQREVKEEVGLDIVVERPLGIYWGFRKREDNAQVVCFTFLCRPRHKRIKLDGNPDKEERVLEAWWVSREEFLKDNVRVNHGSLKRLISEL